MLYVHIYITDNKPQLCQLKEIKTHDGRLVRIIDSVAFKWEELAITLGFGGAAIERIKIDAFYKSKDCTIAMLKEWLNEESASCVPATWTTIIQCLIDSELAEIAKDLESGTYDNIILFSLMITTIIILL